MIFFPPPTFWIFLTAPRHTETPLHIAVRLGLYHLTLFYLHQSGGQDMATRLNEEGHTPADLAQTTGHASTIRALAEWVTSTALTLTWRRKSLIGGAGEVNLLKKIQIKLTQSSNPCHAVYQEVIVLENIVMQLNERLDVYSDVLQHPTAKLSRTALRTLQWALYMIFAYLLYLFYII